MLCHFSDEKSRWEVPNTTTATIQTQAVPAENFETSKFEIYPLMVVIVVNLLSLNPS